MNNFTYVGNCYGKKCAFCKAAVSVKYIVILDSKYPAESVVTHEKVYACNKCVAHQIAEGKLH